jgi:hypothetical protein
VSVNLRSQPLTHVGATGRMEYDAVYSKVLSVSTGADYGVPNKQVAVAWSRSLSSFYPTQTLNGTTRLIFKDERLGTSYSIYWDIEQGRIMQQRGTAFYNAQCCGIILEYQEQSIGFFAAAGTPKIRRFNLGFTLAGLGTFSNFFGNFGGASY